MGHFLKNLSFETGISAHRAMIRTQGFRGASLGSLQTFWQLFPWRSTFSRKNPQRPIITHISSIYDYIGGHMGQMGDRQGKNKYIFLTPSMYCSFKKKGGIHWFTSWKDTELIVKIISRVLI